MILFTTATDSLKTSYTNLEERGMTCYGVDRKSMLSGSEKGNRGFNQKHNWHPRTSK